MYYHTREEFDRISKDEPDKLFRLMQGAMTDRDAFKDRSDMCDQELETKDQEIEELIGNAGRDSNTIDELTMSNRLLEHMLEHAIAKQGAGARAGAGRDNHHSRSNKDDPPIFDDGSEGLEFDSWLSRMKKKLDEDRNQYDTEDRHISYI